MINNQEIWMKNFNMKYKLSEHFKSTIIQLLELYFGEKFAAIFSINSPPYAEPTVL